MTINNKSSFLHFFLPFCLLIAYEQDPAQSQGPVQGIASTNDMNMMEVPDESELQNEYVMSYTQALGPKSFIDSRDPFNPVTPPPKYLTKE